MNGKWFSGWGFMRFWELDGRTVRAVNCVGIATQVGDGDGDDELFHGRINAPALGHGVTMLGASPREIGGRYSRH